MPRQARIGLPAQIYHVTNRGNNRDWVFREGEDFRRYIDILARYKSKGEFLLYHWVLMNNHVHLLMSIPASGSLARTMHGINLAYTVWFNRKYKRVGHLWQGRFKSFPVEEDRYLLECGRYIERNPVRAGLVENPGDYPWSSFRFHGKICRDTITDCHGIFASQFGGTESYADFVCTPRMREEQDLLEKMASGVIGTDTYQDLMKNAVLSARRPKRGRPKFIRK